MYCKGEKNGRGKLIPSSSVRRTYVRLGPGAEIVRIFGLLKYNLTKLKFYGIINYKIKK